MMLFFPILCLSLISYCTASLDTIHRRHTRTSDTPVRRAQSNPDPVVTGSTDEGWAEFPDIPDATAYPDWVVDKDSNAKIPLYQSSGVDPKAVKRAVIILPGKPRDCWYYWTVMNNALYVAAEADPSIKREEISILGPCFFAENDLNAGAAKSDQLLWGLTTWVRGASNVGPSSIKDFSAYDVIDSLVDYYMDTDTFPNLNVVMIAGHSAGAQMAQRYLALRKSTKNDERLHYWIANPGSILWLTEDRPLPNDACEGVDKYKYGLADGFPAYAKKDAKKKGREGIVSRYRQRNAHYAWGLADEGAGDTRCQAQTQGMTHLERGQNFVAMLDGMSGGMPNHTTVDFVVGASHDNVEMMNSAAGGDKLFRYNYNGTNLVYATSGEPNYDAEEANGSTINLISQTMAMLALITSALLLH
ncbi:hypothetical protein BDZ89DRAFT_410525 [Hymenopellis radicata]|nr:hypothetical protein BDZ89DRAFT_410525 [Hymenopellis radicata]